MEVREKWKKDPKGYVWRSIEINGTWGPWEITPHLEIPYVEYEWADPTPLDNTEEDQR